MRRKQFWYGILAVTGFCLAAAALLLQSRGIPDRMGGALIGAGSGLAAMGLAQPLTLRTLETDPVRKRRTEIEAGDERNRAIRSRAKALAGDALQWAVMAAAWLSIGLGSPVWVTLLAVAVFLGKSILELCLTVQYQRQM